MIRAVCDVVFTTLNKKKETNHGNKKKTNE